MKKLLIPFLFIGYALCTQSCKKTVSDYTTTIPVFQASINSTVWTPDTISTSITYNSASNSHILSCVGTQGQKQVSFSVNERGGATSVGYPIGTYTIDSTSAVAFTYSVLQKNSSGNYVYVPQGTVKPGSGSVTISAVDTVKKTITGTFSFSPSNRTYDSNGNLTSITVINVSAGQFNNLPYTFKRN